MSFKEELILDRLREELDVQLWEEAYEDEEYRMLTVEQQRYLIEENLEPDFYESKS